MENNSGKVIAAIVGSLLWIVIVALVVFYAKGSFGGSSSNESVVSSDKHSDDSSDDSSQDSSEDSSDESDDGKEDKDDDKDDKDKTADELFDDYVEDMKFLCKTGEEEYNINGTFNAATNSMDYEDKTPDLALTYDIDDFDNDGTNELLIIQAEYVVPDSVKKAAEEQAQADAAAQGTEPKEPKYTKGQQDHVLYLEMYEVKGHKVKKEATYRQDKNKRISLYGLSENGFVNTYKWDNDGEKNISMESKKYGNFASGHEFVYEAVSYDGSDFEKVGRYIYYGSEASDNEYDEMESDFEKYGIELDAYNYHSDIDDKISNYIENPEYIGCIKSEFIGESGDMTGYSNSPVSRVTFYPHGEKDE